MNFKALCKCHSHYLFNKTFIIIVLVISTIFICFILSVLNDLDLKMGKSEYREVYFQTIFECLKILLILMGILIACFSFSDSNNEYQKLVLTINTSKPFLIRIIFILTKIFVLAIFLLLCEFLLIIILVILPLSEGFTIIIGMCKSFYYLYLGVINYFAITVLLMQIANNYYIVFITIILFIISMITETTYLSYFVTCFQNSNLTINSFYYSILILVIIFTNILVFCNRDLP